MMLPRELIWIQRLTDRYGVAGLLRLISVNCCDRAGTPADNLQQWAKMATIVADAAQQARRIVPERMISITTARREPNEKGAAMARKARVKI